MLMAREWTTLLAILAVLLTTAAQLSLKVGVSAAPVQNALGANSVTTFLGQAALSPLVLVGLLLYVLSTVVWLLVLARADVTYAYPFVSLGFVLIAIFAYFFLNEPMPAFRIVGITLITAGVWLVARS